MRFSHDDDQRVVYRAVLTSTKDGASGRLQVENGLGPPLVRDVDGANCDEVVSALALIVALAIDPNAKTGTVADKPLSTVVEQPTPASTVPWRWALEPPRGSGAARRWGLRQMDLGVAYWWSAALAPGGSSGLSMLAEAMLGDRPMMMLRLSTQIATSGDEAVGSGSGRFDYLGGAIDLCPAGFAKGSTWRALLCGGLSAGRTRAIGLDVANPHDSSHGSVALQGKMQGAVTLGLGIVAVGGVGVWAPLGSRTYVFEGPREVVWVQPSAGLMAEFGLACSVL